MQGEFSLINAISRLCQFSYYTFIFSVNNLYADKISPHCSPERLVLFLRVGDAHMASALICSIKCDKMLKNEIVSTLCNMSAGLLEISRPEYCLTS